jgi:hypothetical protein
MEMVVKKVTLTMNDETRELSKEVMEVSKLSQSGLYAYLVHTYGRGLIESLRPASGIRGSHKT